VKSLDPYRRQAEQASVLYQAVSLASRDNDAAKAKEPGSEHKLGDLTLWPGEPRRTKGGTVVGYGFMRARETKFGAIRTFASIFIGARLAGRRGTFYGITAVYRKNKQPLKEDLIKLLEMLRQKHEARRKRAIPPPAK
jgi:hypothetical protein